jgi:hypothetical protein
MTYYLVHYGGFSAEYVEHMKPFERDFYCEKVHNSIKHDQNFQAQLHDKRIE